MSNAMSKEDVVKKLEEGIYWEEKFISKYDNEVTWILLKEALDRRRFEEIKKLFSENLSDTEKHQRKLKELVEKIKSGEYEI